MSNFLRRLVGWGLSGHSGNRHLGPPYYLLNDTYTTNRSAGAVNGTNAEPGPGRRYVTDTDGDALLLTGGAARFQNPNSSNGNPGLWYEGQSRRPGLLLKATAVYAAFSGFSYPCGWDADQSALGDLQFRLTGAGSLQTYQGGVGPVVATFSTGTHSFVVAVRSAGAYYLAKPHGESHYLLYWITNTGGNASLKPTISNHSQASFDVERLVVPALRWLPVPLASDGFSAWGTTDGLGHAEGVAGGLGSGGGGLAWEDIPGSGWTASGGLALPAGGSGGEIVAINTGTADVIATVKFTRASDNGGVVVRCDATAANYVKGIHNGTNAQLIKVVGGTPTTLINNAAAYVDGADIRVIAEGQKFRLFYNNAAVGTEQTIADAGLQGGTRQGMVNVDGANAFDDFRVMARGSGGEYDDLDDF